MISRVRGALVRRDIGSVEIMTDSGVAYEIEIPLSVFERLPQDLEHVAAELEHLVEKQHAVVGEADLAGARLRPPTDECRV